MRGTKEHVLKWTAILAAIVVPFMGFTPAAATHSASPITIYYGDDETLDAVWQYDVCTGGDCQAIEGTGEGSTSASRITEFASEEERAWIGADFVLARRCDSQAIVAPFAMLFVGDLSATTAVTGTGTASTIIRAHPVDPTDDIVAGTLATAAAGTDVPSTGFSFPYADVGILPEGERYYTPAVSIDSDVETGATVNDVTPSATATGYFQLDRIDVVFGDEVEPIPSFTVASSDETPQGGGLLGFQGWYQAPVTVTTTAPDPIEVDSLAVANSCTKKIEVRADTVVVDTEDDLAGGNAETVFSTDGRFDMTADAWDYALNRGSSDGTFEFGIDTVAPTVTGDGLQPATPNGLGGWYREPVNAGESRVSVHRACADPALTDGEDGSGCQGILWRFNNNAYLNGGTPLTKTFQQGNDVTYDTYAPDNAGNGGVGTAVRVGPLDVDFGFPSISISGHTSNGWHKALTDVVTISCSFDGVSGCASAENDAYGCNGVEFARVAAPYAVRDNAGNWVNGTLTNGFGCDATRPTTAGAAELLVAANTVSGKKYTNLTPSWEFACSTDALSGVASYEIRINGNAFTSLGSDCGGDNKHTYTHTAAVPNTEYCLRAVAIDHAGNRDNGVGGGTCVTFDNLAPDLSWLVPQPGLYWDGVHIPALTQDALVLGDLDVTLGIEDEVGTHSAEIWREEGSSPDVRVANCTSVGLSTCVWQDHPDQQDITWTGMDLTELYASGWDYALNKNTSAVDYQRIGLAAVQDFCEDDAQDVCAALYYPGLMNGAAGTVVTLYKSTSQATLYSLGNVIRTTTSTAADRVDDTNVVAGTVYYYGIKVVNGLDEDVHTIRYEHSNVRYTVSQIV